jgi:hypothetical protein
MFENCKIIAIENYIKPEEGRSIKSYLDEYDQNTLYACILTSQPNTFVQLIHVGKILKIKRHLIILPYEIESNHQVIFFTTILLAYIKGTRSFHFVNVMNECDTSILPLLYFLSALSSLPPFASSLRWL